LESKRNGNTAINAAAYFMRVDNLTENAQRVASTTLIQAPVTTIKCCLRKARRITPRENFIITFYIFYNTPGNNRIGCCCGQGIKLEFSFLNHLPWRIRNPGEPFVFMHQKRSMAFLQKLIKMY
jgi:hypothetical protein